MRWIVLLFCTLIPLSVQAQTFCTKTGDSIHCNDYESPFARDDLEKLDKDSWEYRRGVEDLDKARQERIDTEIKKIHEREIEEMESAQRRKKNDETLSKLFGQTKPVKVDADGFFYD